MSNQKDCSKVINVKDNTNGCCPKLLLPQLVCHYTVNTEKMKNKLSCSKDNRSDKDEKDILAGDAHNKDNERDECGKDHREGMERGVICREEGKREHTEWMKASVSWKTKRSIQREKDKNDKALKFSPWDCVMHTLVFHLTWKPSLLCVFWCRLCLSHSPPFNSGSSLQDTPKKTHHWRQTK